MVFKISQSLRPSSCAAVIKMKSGGREEIVSAFRTGEPFGKLTSYKLPNVYDSVLRSLPKVSNSWELGHSADETCSDSS